MPSSFLLLILSCCKLSNVYFLITNEFLKLNLSELELAVSFSSAYLRPAHGTWIFSEIFLHRQKFLVSMLISFYMILAVVLSREQQENNGGSAVPGKRTCSKRTPEPGVETLEKKPKTSKLDYSIQ